MSMFLDQPTPLDLYPIEEIAQRGSWGGSTFTYRGAGLSACQATMSAACSWLAISSAAIHSAHLAPSRRWWISGSRNSSCQGTCGGRGGCGELLHLGSAHTGGQLSQSPIG